MSDIGLSRLAETFSLEVTVLTPVTQRLWPHSIHFWLDVNKTKRLFVV